MYKFSCYYVMALLAIFIFVPDVQAAVINSTSCSRSDVQAAITSASDGDTVVLPPGTCPWTTELTITKGLTLQGGGSGVTVLVDNVVKDGSPTSHLIVWNVAEPRRFRMTALTVQGSAADSAVYNQGHIVVAGTTKAWRIDHVNFTNMQTAGIRIFGWTYGLVDHCTFNYDFKQAVLVEHDAWGGKSFGDGSWAADDTFGTEKAIYIEDCTFNNANTSVATGAIDAVDGGRYVARYNTFNNEFAASHGTESGGRRRGMRQFEIYNNTFVATDLLDRAVYIRSGTGVIFNNTVTKFNFLFALANYRDDNLFDPWGKCDGTSPYDANLPGQSGYPCVDQVGRGKSVLLSGDLPTPVAWPNEVSDPVYQWNNTLSPGVAAGGSDGAHIQVNRDWFNNIAKPGYTPYAYPHPLTAASGRPAPPRNLRGVVN